MVTFNDYQEATSYSNAIGSLKQNSLNNLLSQPSIKPNKSGDIGTVSGHKRITTEILKPNRSTFDKYINNQPATHQEEAEEANH
jgi:hypothetical protein